MEIRLQFTSGGVSWDQVAEILKMNGMASYSADLHRKAFENSYSSVFAFDGDTLVGFARALSDGAYQAALYDVAVKPEYQRKGVGKRMVESIVMNCPGCNFILYASPGKEAFYRKINFRRMNTGMALFTGSEKMKEKGFTD
jgi:ribosomal protein S18 acetylase RimI-like enzyme